ncbi:sorbosone dehydrogenase [Bryobacterales bacterium F-183]|nr:sorbosone dehydrogenase [Bryobacterales bacterium F-183]
MKYTSALLIAAAIPCLAADDNKPKLPPPFATPSSTNRPKVIAKPEGAKLAVPAGFTVEEYAGDFQRPRMMILGPSNELLVSDSVRDEGAVYVFDKNKNRKALIQNLNGPYGMAFWKDYLYVAEITSVKRYKYDKAAMTVGKGEEIINLKDFGKGHWTRCIIFDAKGEKLYLGIGSESNVSPGEDPMRAAILKFNPDGSGKEFVATGTRNPTSIRFVPGTSTLVAAVQERDLLGDDLVPDYLTTIKPGGFYGWPYSYIGPNEDPRNKGQKPDLVAKTIVPDLLLGAHVAVLDFNFYNGKMFPAEYRGGAFVALHGSWNRSKRVGQTVVYVPFKNGKPSGPIKDFLSGWMLSPDKQEVWGRPVGILVMPDGSLLVTDDGGNKIWRITYKG